MCIVCPQCRNYLTPELKQLNCKTCGNIYPVIDDIADLYIDETTSDISQKVERANIDHYNRNVEKFEENVIRSSDDFYSYERDMLEEMSENGKDRILDVGTGTGKILQLAAPFYQELYGIDVSMEMLIQTMIF